MVGWVLTELIAIKRQDLALAIVKRKGRPAPLQTPPAPPLPGADQPDEERRNGEGGGARATSGTNLGDRAVGRAVREQKEREEAKEAKIELDRAMRKLTELELRRRIEDGFSSGDVSVFFWVCMKLVVTGLANYWNVWERISWPPGRLQVSGAGAVRVSSHRFAATWQSAV